MRRECATDPGTISVGRILRETVTLSRSITVLHSAFMGSAVSPGTSLLSERSSPPALVGPKLCYWRV